ncbi:MAG TPA: DUF935 family protein [Verrucomicrobiae bacterium]|nr:DUF935 family protein [Verrucomicrobiae bacterium]
MVQELRVKQQSQSLYVRALSSAWRNGVQLYDPSLWLLRDPDAEEKMLRDADIAHAIGYRRAIVAGLDWSCSPLIPNSPRADLAVSVGTDLLKSIRHFTQARDNLARAFFSGARFARIHGEVRTRDFGDGRPRQWWCPVRLEDMDKRMFRIVPKNDGKTITAHWERWDVARQEFRVETVDDAVHTIRHVYQDDEGSLGYGRALREALGWWWYAKEHVFSESLKAVERFAQGIIAARVEGVRDAATNLPNVELIREWQNVLEDLRARHVLVYDSADQVETIQMNGEGWQLLKTIRDEIRATIFTLVLGANLPTSADKGGSYALADVQQDSTELIIKRDRGSLGETLTDDLLGCVWFYNHANLVELGIDQERPTFETSHEKQQDPEKRANTASTLNGMGVDLALDDVLDQTGFRLPKVGEPVVKGRAAAAPGAGGGDPLNVFPFRRPVP